MKSHVPPPFPPRSSPTNLEKVGDDLEETVRGWDLVERVENQPHHTQQRRQAGSKGGGKGRGEGEGHQIAQSEKLTKVADKHSGEKTSSRNKTKAKSLQTRDLTQRERKNGQTYMGQIEVRWQ